MSGVCLSLVLSFPGPVGPVTRSKRMDDFIHFPATAFSWKVDLQVFKERVQMKQYPHKIMKSI